MSALAAAQAAPVQMHVRKPGPYPRGRLCPERSCITILTTWDPGPLCFKCAPAESREGARIPPDEIDAMRDLMEAV